MKTISASWTRAIKASADPPRAKHFLEVLAGTAAGSKLQKFGPEEARILACFFSGSPAMSELLAANPDWIELIETESLKPARRKELCSEINEWLGPLIGERSFATAFTRLRHFKQRQMLRSAARDLASLATVPEIIQEISDIADVCLESAWRLCHLQLVERYGEPFHQDASGGWHPTAGCAIGLGKLGGHELNYSSDVDLIFVYVEEGTVFRGPRDDVRGAKGKGKDKPGLRPGAQATISNHQFFNRLAEALVTEVTRMGPEGTLYRIDLRLRPEGDAGPLSRSLEAYENYYAQWGQTWERMMLLKGRGVAGDAALASEFLELVQPFRYPRSITSGVLHEIAAMKDRIEEEVVRAGELERNIKLGRGGIREIEFIVQAQQLLHGGKQPFLQTAQTLTGLEKLAQYGWLQPKQTQELSQSYCFFRALEHRLQMEANLQTHTIPPGQQAQKRLARLMGFSSLEKFEAARASHATQTRRMFHALFKPERRTEHPVSAFPRQFQREGEQWKKFLAEHRFRDTERAIKVLREFVEGPGYVHVSERTSNLAYGLLTRLFELCPGRSYECRVSRVVGGGDEWRVTSDAGSRPSTLDPRHPSPITRHILSDPDRVVTRLDSFISAYGARATLFELWNANPSIFDMIVLLFDRSEFLAELAIRTPDLVDELVTSGRLRRRKSAEQTLRDLRHGLSDPDQHLWLRRYHQAELMRIGLRDILGLADFEQYLTELSALADACLQYSLEVLMRQHRFKNPPFAMIGLGKLGGSEIDYGSDLDLLFIAPSGSKELPKLSRLAVGVMDLLSRRTEQGVLFHTDARLRPDGEKGLLVNTLTAYEQYYRRRAQLWEIQSLTRTRLVAGDGGLGQQFQTLAATLTNFKNPSAPLPAFSPEWKQEIHRMRMRIEKERTPAGKDELAIKTGKGGLMDAEFIAQTLCMENGWQEANTLRALEKGRAAKVLPESESLIDNYRQIRRIEGILRRWSYEGETVLPDDPAPYYRVAIRCGFGSSEEFREAVAQNRQAIRRAYSKVFPVRV
jgi:glutamate-ammonia-ligase adenylyltransferase